MAEIKVGLLEPLKRKVGSVVGVQYRGKNILRALPKKTKKQASPKQIQQRKKLIVVVQFLKGIRTFVNAHYPQKTIDCAIKVGYDQIRSTLMKEGIIWHEDTPNIRAEKVVLALGPLLPVKIKKIAWLKNRKIKIQWDATLLHGLTSPSDSLTLVLYNEHLNQFEQRDALGKREDKYNMIDLPQTWIHERIHFWSVWSNPTQTMHSTSIYHTPLDIP